MTIVTCFTSKKMTEIKKGLPNISTTNGHFKKGRQVASDLINAGPGHHTVVEFGPNQTEDMKSFSNGARYIAKQNPTLKVARRADSDKGVINVYVINED